MKYKCKRRVDVSQRSCREKYMYWQVLLSKAFLWTWSRSRKEPKHLARPGAVIKYRLRLLAPGPRASQTKELNILILFARRALRYMNKMFNTKVDNVYLLVYDFSWKKLCPQLLAVIGAGLIPKTKLCENRCLSWARAKTNSFSSTIHSS